MRIHESNLEVRVFSTASNIHAQGITPLSQLKVKYCDVFLVNVRLIEDERAADPEISHSTYQEKDVWIV